MKKMAKYAGISRISMRRVIMDDLQLARYKKKTVSTGNFRIFKAEKPGQGQVDAKGNGAWKSTAKFIWKCCRKKFFLGSLKILITN